MINISALEKSALEKIDKLKISKADQSFLSVLAIHAKNIDHKVLLDISKKSLSGDALTVAKELLSRSARDGSDVSAAHSSQAGVKEYVDVLMKWAGQQR